MSTCVDADAMLTPSAVTRSICKSALPVSLGMSLKLLISSGRQGPSRRTIARVVPPKMRQPPAFRLTVMTARGGSGPVKSMVMTNGVST